MTPAPVLYYDLGSPFAYLAVERAAAVLGEAPSLQPVLLGGLFRLTGRSSWALGDHERRQRGMADIERRAQRCGLPPLRWPDPWPSDYLFAMRAATHAHRTGRGDAFARAAFRHAFVDGNDLSIPERVLEAGELAQIDRDELAQAVADPAVKSALREATDAAHARGVFGVPTVAVAGELLWGDDRLESAARLLASERTAP
jgi:2-hydroxychromene-2-carboxylate isomerase